MTTGQSYNGRCHSTYLRSSMPRSLAKWLPVPSLSRPRTCATDLHRTRHSRCNGGSVIDHVHILCSRPLTLAYPIRSSPKPVQRQNTRPWRQNISSSGLSIIIDDRQRFQDEVHSRARRAGLSGAMHDGRCQGPVLAGSVGRQPAWLD